jgi:hypothetical protein
LRDRYNQGAIQQGTPTQNSMQYVLTVETNDYIISTKPKKCNSFSSEYFQEYEKFIKIIIDCLGWQMVQ